MNDAATRPGAMPFHDSRALLQAELDWLDEALRHLVRALARPEGEDGGHGWFISAEEADRLLAPQKRPDAEAEALLPLRAGRRDILARREASAAAGAPLAQLRLAQIFGLSPLEELILLVCLAPEQDPRYGRVYGYLHDDLTRRQPSLLLVASVARLDETFGDVERLLLGQDLPVFRWHLASLQGDAAGPSHRLAQGLSIDPRIAAFLLDAAQLDARILPCLRPLPQIMAPGTVLAATGVPFTTWSGRWGEARGPGSPGVQARYRMPGSQIRSIRVDFGARREPGNAPRGPDL